MIGNGKPLTRCISELKKAAIENFDRSFLMTKTNEQIIDQRIASLSIFVLGTL